jgi:hypothetical protein
VTPVDRPKDGAKPLRSGPKPHAAQAILLTPDHRPREATVIEMHASNAAIPEPITSDTCELWVPPGADVVENQMISWAALGAGWEDMTDWDRSYARSVTSISHIVLVAWKDGLQSSAEDLVRSAIRGFVDSIPQVQSVVEGHSSSPEGLEDGFDYGFVVNFATEQARDSYLEDPVHRPVAEAIGAAAERIVVFDI